LIIENHIAELLNRSNEHSTSVFSVWNQWHVLLFNCSFQDQKCQ